MNCLRLSVSHLTSVVPRPVAPVTRSFHGHAPSSSSRWRFARARCSQVELKSHSNSHPWLRMKLRGFTAASINTTPSASAGAVPMGTANAHQAAKQADSGMGSIEANPLTGSVPGTVPMPVDGKTSSLGDAPGAVAGGSGEQFEQVTDANANNYLLPHPLWKDEFVWGVKYTHLPVKDNIDKLALATIQALRFNFDWMSGYSFGSLTEKKALTRIMFLETVAGVPGSIGGTLRHLASLRRMKRDGGWIRTLLDEAENERMHLLIALQLRQPGRILRTAVFLTQGVFYNFFWLSYMISPHFCHRLVGYLEEEAVVTYTKILHQIDSPTGSLRAWKDLPAPEIARTYYSLPATATFRDVLAYIRADEAHHRDVNHRLGSIPGNALNPFRSDT